MRRSPDERKDGAPMLSHVPDLIGANPGAQTAYMPGQPLEIYVAGRLRTRIRSAAEPNARGPVGQSSGRA